MKTIIITGANSGLGFETARKIARNPDYKVILACRNEEKSSAARERIVKETGNENIVPLRLDISSLSSVRSFAQQIITVGGKVDALVNNAGISSMNHTGTTIDGIEVVFATNYLGHFLLTQLLLSHMADKGRIVNISSDMHNPPGGIQWPELETLVHPERNDRRNYSWSKLCMIYFTHELDSRLQAENRHVTVNAFNPGYMANTNFFGRLGPIGGLVVKIAMPNRYGSLQVSSDALARLVMDESFEDVSGLYFDRSVNAVKSSALSYSVENAQELWTASLKWCGIQ